MDQQTQNPVLASSNSVFDSILGALDKGVGIYSSFIGAKAAAKLQSMQQTYTPYTPTYGPALAADTAVSNQRVVNYLVYGGVALALLAVGGIVWKQVK